MPLDRRTFLKTAGAAIALPAISGSAWGKTPDVVSLEQYQTGYRNQGSRGTCYIFGISAAIEAAYKRKYGLNLHLSEQCAFHVCRSAPNPDPQSARRSAAGAGLRQKSAKRVQSPAIQCIPNLHRSNRTAQARRAL
jgi:TAT (twin-arginine translocation) pathway signal sequence